MPKKNIAEKETIKEEIKEDINKNLKEEILEELNDKIDAKIKVSVNNEVERINKKIISAKNRKIFFKNIIIIILLAVIVYLLYLLKTANYFDKYFNSSNTKEPIVDVTEENKESEKPSEAPKELKPTLDELKEKYESFLNDLYLDESSNYINVLYDEGLTKEVRQYFVVNKATKEELNTEDNYNIITNANFKKLYEKLYTDEYVPINFEYNDNNVRYISKIESYITDKLITKEKTDIVREIVNIEENKDGVIITTIEGLKRENKIFNILTKEEICDESKMKDNSSKLNKLIYTFNNDKQLLNITSKEK